MKTKIDWAFSILLLLLGITHTTLTPMFYPHFTEDALWFAGAGLSLIFLAFLNISRIVSGDFNTRIICAVANMLGLGFIVCLLGTGDEVSIQAFISLACYFMLALLGLHDAGTALRMRREQRTQGIRP